MTSVAACSFFSFAVWGAEKRKIPARLQGLQTAKRCFALQELKIQHHE